MITTIIKKVLIVLLFINIALNASEIKKQTELDIVLSLVSSMSETVHSLQQERGASCGYISSNGKKFKEKLLRIENKSVIKINDLYAILDKNKKIIEKYLNKKEYNRLNKTIENLYLAREKVLSLKIGFAKTYSKYTQSIAFMLLKISDISDKIENKELNDALYIYSTLLMHKESIGQKRAALSSLFSQKDFAKEIFEYFLTSDTQEKIYLKSFLHSVDDDVKKLYKDTLNNPAINIVQKYEKLAQDKLSGKYVEVDAQDWFINITKKINLVQDVEHKIFENILMIVYKINTNSVITLTKDEQKWLENNQIIKIAIMNYWTHDASGNSLHTDMLKLLNKYGNINIIPARYDAWKDGFAEASNGENLHGIMNLSWSQEREDEYFNYTKAYNYAPNYLVVKADNSNVKSLYDLKNKSIYLKEKAITHKIVSDISKSIKVIDLKTDGEMYKKLSISTKVDAFVSYSVNKDKLKQYNLKIAKTMYDKTGEVSIGVHKNYPYLASIINKIYKSIPHKLMEELRNKEYISNNLNLTQDEKRWIQTHRVKIGVEQWAPVVFSNDGKDIDGIAGDFTKKLIEKTNLKVEIVNENWDKLLKDFGDKKIDILPATYYTDKRAEFGLYSDGYFKMKDAIYVKKSNSDIKSLKDLVGKTLAIPKGYGTIDKLKKEFPNITLVLTKDMDDSINRVLNGRVTAFYEGQIAAEAKVKNELIEGLKAIPVKAFKAPTLHFFSNIDEPLLQSIIQKTIKSLTYQERDAIVSKWITSTNKLRLTKLEQKWLDKEEPIAYVYDPDWAPFEWTNELEQHTGIIADILDIIESNSGIKFNPVTTKTWKESVVKMEEKSVDMYSAVVENEKRRKYAQFTSKNIYSSPGVIVSRINDDTVYVDIKSALEMKTVGVVSGNSVFDYLKKTYPNLSFKEVVSTKDGFEKLKNEQIDVFILNAATAQYFIKQNGYEARIATKIDFSFDLKIAIQKNMPQEVLSILDKAINNISKKELNDIYHKWTQIQVEKKIDWKLFGQIGGAIALLILFILWNNYKLKSTVEEKTKNLKDVLDSMEVTISDRTKELNDEKNFINTIMDSQENFVITSDGKCLKTVNKAFYNFYNVKDTDEFMEKFGSCICDTFDKTAPKEYIQKVMGEEKWLEYVNTRPNEIHKTRIKKDGKSHIFTITSEKVYIKGQELKTAIFTDITKMEKVKEEVESILANILLPVLITSKKDRVILYANKYAENQYDKTLDEIIGSPIDDVYTIEGQQQHIIDAIKKYGRIENSEEIFKTSMGKEFAALLSVTPVFYNEEECYIGMVTDISKQKKMENEVRAIHKHTRDAIEYASLIQGALLPTKDVMVPFFKDHFITWIPKDTVGGDIWLFNELRHKDECLLMFIDCTGHGVPGAFVTMIVKAVEREIISKIKADRYNDIDVSPAWVMGYFNNTMKKLLKQETKDSLSNAGWDGGVIYYNKRTQILKFAGAETPLFYMTKDGEFKTVKGNRYSVGYKKCAMDYEYKETIIEVEEGMKFYCTTDGYLDQNGGEKDFPFGKKRFGNIIKKHHKEPMTQLQTIFQEEMSEYEGMIPNNDRNDDMTIISFEIGEQSDFIEDKIIEIVKYEGVMTQNVIASAMDNIETKITNMGMMGTVSTITIEYCQNMMNYSKGIREEDGNDIIPAGQIEVQYINDESYEIIATNIVSIEDKEKIEPKLIEIQGLDKSGIKKRYRELRKSGENTHGKGGGIGMYEIAKVSTSIEYEFNKINDDKYYFTMKSFIKSKVKEKEEES